MLDENNVFQAILEFANTKYARRGQDFFDSYIEEFPERDWDLPEELWVKNYLSWLFIEKVLPDTGMTIAEEFLTTTGELEPDLKEDLIRAKDEMVRSDFVVVSIKKRILRIRSIDNDLSYDVKLIEEQPHISRGSLITGRIHKFGAYYRFQGIFMTKNLPIILDPAVMMQRYEEEEVARYDGMLIRKSTTFRSVLKKYPAIWINWMCEHYDIEERLKKDKIGRIEQRITEDIKTIAGGLSPEAKEVLRICLDEGGFIKIGKLKRFEDDTTLFWKEGSDTPVGELRQKGLLFVGKMKIADRNYKTAFVPNEFRDGLRSSLGSQTSLSI